MNFLEKLDMLMAQNNMKKPMLSEISGVPYTTIDAFYKKGFDNIKMSTVKKIASALDVSLDYLLNDSITDPLYGKTQMVSLSAHELRLVRDYRELDDWGQGSVDSVLAREHERCQQASTLARKYHLEVVAAHAEGATLDEQEDALSKLLAAHPEFGD